MKYLLDTHAFLWWLADDKRLGRKARAAIASPRSSVFVSAASTWEIAIKLARGKLRMRPVDVRALADLPTRSGFYDMPITSAHAVLLRDLAPHHEDPFDRMLVAQALCEDCTLVTADEQLDAYSARLLDASA